MNNEEIEIGNNLQALLMSMSTSQGIKEALEIIFNSEHAKLVASGENNDCNHKWGEYKLLSMMRSGVASQILTQECCECGYIRIISK